MARNFGWTRGARRVIVVCGMVGGTVTALTPLAQATSAGTLYVNATSGADGGTCRLQTHPCASISYALTQAPAGATIKVAAGQYPQPLTITQPVTIQGAGISPTTGTVINPATLGSDTDTDGSQTESTVVDVKNTTGVNLRGLDIDGSPAEGNFNSCALGFVGVYYHDASGSMKTVKVQNIRLPLDLFGCQDGLAVYAASDADATTSLSMTGLTVTAFDKNGVTCDDAGTTCSLASSHITGIGSTGLIAQNGFQGFDAASVTLSGDTVTKDTYTGGGNGNQATGLLIYDVGAVSVTGSTLSANDVDGYFADDGTGPAAGTWTVSGNTVTTATDKVAGGETGYGDGIDLDSTSNSVTISSNTVKNDAEYGIALTGASNSTVTGNTVTGNKSDGIYVGGPGSAITQSQGNEISLNATNANKADGIFADSDAVNNTFSANTAFQNVAFDLHEASPGSNDWSSNTCRPVHDSNPAGLC